MSFSTPLTPIETALVHKLEWDSEHFGRKIAKVHYENVSPATLPQAVSWADASAFDCLCLLVPASDVDMIFAAESSGFRCVDIRLTLEAQLSHLNGADVNGALLNGTEDISGIREFQPSDTARLRQIARASHTGTRFFRDPNFLRPDCERLYEQWIERSCAGDASFVLVAQGSESASGYITCHQSGTDAAIGLLAVSEEDRRIGLGSALVRAASAYAQRRGALRATVVTQGTEPRAQRLYQRCGFLTKSVELWFHRWRQ